MLCLRAKRAIVVTAHDYGYTVAAHAHGPEAMRRAVVGGIDSIEHGTHEGVFPHGENWRDFSLLVQAGVPAMYAVQMATINAARLIKHDDELGSVTVGKQADVMAVKGNPLENIQLMGKIDFVMRAGVIYKQDGHEIAPDWAPR